MFESAREPLMSESQEQMITGRVWERRHVCCINGAYGLHIFASAVLLGTAYRPLARNDTGNVWIDSCKKEILRGQSKLQSVLQARYETGVPTA
jgi:hypothetical protein